MIPELIPVFLNGRAVTMPSGSSLADLVRAAEPDLAPALLAGGVRATDGRGIEVPADAPISAGAIFRVFRSARGGAMPDA